MSRSSLASRGLLVSVLTFSTFLFSSSVVPSQAVLSDSSKVTVASKSDKIAAPSGLKVTSIGGGTNSLSWTASASAYTTGYKILRSTSVYGPWTTIANVTGRGTVTYSDTTAGATQWVYRVEASWQNWMSVSVGYEAPPVVGLSFTDGLGFTGTQAGVAGDMDGRTTDDGSSTWQVWTGSVYINAYYNWGFGAQGSGYGALPATAVVRTPTQNATVWGADFDSSEGFVIRGKDPKNFIHVGGKIGSTRDDGSFEIATVSNGVRTVLYSTTIGANQDVRVEVEGTTIRAYKGAVKEYGGAGTLIRTQTTSFLANDPTATYFGIALTGDYLMRGFNFEAIV